MKTFVIIVTYNGMPWIKRCLESCDKYSTVVIDNDSNDETVAFVKKQFPEVKVLVQDKNLGFGQANNLGISYALKKGAEHVFLLNQDAYLFPDTIEVLLDFQKRNPLYWVLSPLHVQGDEKRLDRKFSNYMSFDKNPDFYSDFVLGNTLKEVYPVPFVNAAAWLLSKKCLATVGGFDPIFYHYCEDDNYCQRVLYHGGNVGVVPTTKVIHDRENRKSQLIKPFSEAYYSNKVRQFKYIHANVNSFNEAGLNRKLEFYKKLLIKAILKGSLSQFVYLKQELKLIKQAKLEIVESVRKNRTKGFTYLSFSENK
ncbi:glycosyl transferase family 2 [Tamlana sp. s12]|nr:glycosyl transferase family 2 [Tamlana sp. s12]